MADARFHYWFEVSNWIDGAQEIAVAEPPIDTLRTEIIPSAREEAEARIPVRLELFLSGVSSYEEARSAADEFAERVLTAAAFAGDLAIHHLYFGHGVFNGHLEEGYGRISGFSNTVTVRAGNRPTVPQLVTDLETHLRRSGGPAGSYYAMFRVAMQTDGLGRYLLLYLILLTRFGDNQGRVDTFIRQEEPGVAETPSPHLAGVNETVYTRLRNEASHSRPGASQTVTRSEMERLTPSLIFLVKRMMEGI